MHWNWRNTEQFRMMLPQQATIKENAEADIIIINKENVWLYIDKFCIYLKWST